MTWLYQQGLRGPSQLWGQGKGSRGDHGLREEVGKERWALLLVEKPLEEGSVVRGLCDMDRLLTFGFLVPSQRRGTLAAPVSRRPWMTSTLTIPLGKRSSDFTTLLVSPPPAQGLHPNPPTYPVVWYLELTQLTDGFGRWNRGVFGDGASFCKHGG